jgi:uncharacterized protein (TIGR03663 family)
MDSFIVSRRLMKLAAVIVCWFCVIATGVFLRFDDLGKRPFHADEATGARITARRMETGGYQFDPKHYHGPLLADLAIPLCRARGETRWQELSKTTLRTLPAIAGTLLLLVPLLWRKRFGDPPAILAGAFLATSPLLVYYSRMFIHESLLVLFGMLALASITCKPRWGAAGILIGLMFATKESFAISMIAWSGAGLAVALQCRGFWQREKLAGIWREYRMPVAVSVLTAALTSFAIYTDGFRHAKGAVDAVRTFFVYETVQGHDKPFGYYFELLALPFKSGGMWWFGTPIVLLAVFAFASTFGSGATRGRFTIRFIAFAAVGHFLIYSLFAYKTPWLACLPWAHVCLLAGCGIAGFANRRLVSKSAVVLLAVICLVSQFQQARRATGRFSSDERNPFAYVPTRNDIETIAPWLDQLATVAPGGSLEPVAVVGVDYWPLPWYLRSFGKIGYWKTPAADLEELPLVFALPDSTDAVAAMLGNSHVPLPRGLRAGVPVHLFVRNDIWKNWMETDAR